MTTSKIKAVILAGGKGRRLRPYTFSIPKPMMPVGEKTVMETLVEGLAGHNITEIILSVGYLEHLIRAYFGDGSHWGVSISYSAETEALGTAGPMNLLRDRLDGPFILVNGDTLTDLDWSDMVHRHCRKGGLITAAITPREVKIDLGVVELDGLHLSSWQEKPIKEYWAVMGAYVIEPEALAFLPSGRSDMPELVKAVGRRAVAYIHNGKWLDIGCPEDYARACEDAEWRNG